MILIAPHGGVEFLCTQYGLGRSGLTKDRISKMLDKIADNIAFILVVLAVGYIVVFWVIRFFRTKG